MSDEAQGVSEVARFVGAFAGALPAATRRQLAAMLAHGIAASTPQEVRARRLGLVCELVRGSDRLGVNDYAALRADHVGEDWPAVSTLIEHFGSWPVVLGLAMRLQYEGHRPPVRATHRNFASTRPYSREEVMMAIARAGDVIGHVPSLAEYLEVRSVLRAHAQRTGNAIPRLPVKEVIRNLFGSYREAARSAALWEQS